MDLLISAYVLMKTGGEKNGTHPRPECVKYRTEPIQGLSHGWYPGRLGTYDYSVMECLPSLLPQFFKPHKEEMTLGRSVSAAAESELGRSAGSHLSKLLTIRRSKIQMLKNAALCSLNYN